MNWSVQVNVRMEYSPCIAKCQAKGVYWYHFYAFLCIFNMTRPVTNPSFPELETDTSLSLTDVTTYVLLRAPCPCLIIGVKGQGHNSQVVYVDFKVTVCEQTNRQTSTVQIGFDSTVYAIPIFFVKGSHKTSELLHSVASVNLWALKGLTGGNSTSTKFSPHNI